MTAELVLQSQIKVLAFSHVMSYPPRLAEVQLAGPVQIIACMVVCLEIRLSFRRLVLSGHIYPPGIAMFV